MKVLAMQDLACYGKCSASITLPVLSAMGIETTLLPTSVLSTHSAFAGFTFHDLLPDMEQIVRHWSSLGLTFDAIYIGYLGSQAQLNFALSLIDRYPQALVMVDPVMGDNGKLHRRITPDFIGGYDRLCARAHLLLPNLTETCALLRLPYEPYASGAHDWQPLLQALKARGAKNVVITGLSDGAERLGSLCLDEGGRLRSYFRHRVAGHYHGTGDLFASVLIGALLQKLSLAQALELATDFTVLCIQKTAPYGDAQGSHWHGLHFEACLPQLWQRLSGLCRST